MAEAINMIRKAQQQNSARAIGERTEQPRATVQQQRVARKETEVFAMPVDHTQWQPLQVLDPLSPDFGKFYFMPGYDSPGSDHPLR